MSVLTLPQCPPVIITQANLEDNLNARPMVYNTMKRRSHWPSLEAAQSVRSSPFFAPWTEESFSIWLKTHLVRHPNGGLQLATPPWCEAIVFGEPIGLGEGWDKLAELQVPVGIVMGGDAFFTYGEENTQSMVWRPKNVRNERMMEAGHLVSMLQVA